ncbi:helix-turn-helix transcriptional regulator [Saccharibacillus sacchari]|uniref:helix-turn-helix transcriptional regulator n=1 Tax=Saccharibacillus sacchari TaxID=456493 RepID=UPI0030EBE07B
MKKAERLNAMQRYAYRKRRFTLRELMDEFGISRSTAIRNIQSLEELGLPLFAEQGRLGGYRVLDTASLPPVSFTNDEVLSLYFAMQALRSLSGDPFRVSFASIHAKFLDVVSEEQRKQIERFEHRIAFYPDESAEAGDYLEALLQAAVRGEVLRIRYAAKAKNVEPSAKRGKSEPDSLFDRTADRSFAPVATTSNETPAYLPTIDDTTDRKPVNVVDAHSSIRRIQPFAVYAARGFWYCRAYDLDKSDYRVFRCDRVLSAEPTEDEPIPDLLAFDLRDAHTLRRPSAEAVFFRCSVAPESVTRLRRDLYPSMTLHCPEDPASDALLSGSYEPQEIDFMLHFLVSFGSSIRILEPETLRDRLRSHYLNLIEQL